MTIKSGDLDCSLLFGIKTLSLDPQPPKPKHDPFGYETLRTTFLEYRERQIDKETGLRQKLEEMKAELQKRGNADAAYPLYGGSLGNDFFQFYRMKVIRPMLAELFRDVGNAASTRDEMKRFVEVLLETMGKERNMVAVATKSKNADQFGMQAISSDRPICDDLVYTGWNHHMQAILKRMFFDAFARLEAKGAVTPQKTVSFEALLAEIENDRDFYVYRNENSNDQSHGLPFTDVRELCYIYPREAIGATFLVKHTDLGVGQKAFISREQLTLYFDPKQYLGTPFTQDGSVGGPKAFRNTFTLLCSHTQLHKDDERTVDTVVESFMNIFSFTKCVQSAWDDTAKNLFKALLPAVVIDLSCGTFYSRGQASIMEDILHGGFAGMLKYEIQLSKAWSYDAIGYREKMNLDMRALSHVNTEKFIKEFTENVELVRS